MHTMAVSMKHTCSKVLWYIMQALYVASITTSQMHEDMATSMQGCLLSRLLQERLSLNKVTFMKTSVTGS